jgi:hypothetical protein
MEKSKIKQFHSHQYVMTYFFYYLKGGVQEKIKHKYTF